MRNIELAARGRGIIFDCDAAEERRPFEAQGKQDALRKLRAGRRYDCTSAIPAIISKD